jgi:hypothetical protein
MDDLGEKELLLPDLVNEALRANGRARYFLTLLQAARDHADHPDLEFSNLEEERIACDIQAGDLDHSVERGRKVGDGVYHIPGCKRICDALAGDARRMLEPLLVEKGESASGYEQRESASRPSTGPPSTGSPRTIGR